MRAIRLFAGEKHHAKITVTKWAALCEYGDEYAQHDTPRRRIYQRPGTIVAAAAVQAEPEQNQNGRNAVPELWMLHTIASKSDLEVMIAFLREVQNRIHVKCG
jgi:hypothetical protein